ncbi:MAG: hypothetical protein Q9195_000500 [Heterodermia aff. obscurata]
MSLTGQKRMPMTLEMQKKHLFSSKSPPQSMIAPAYQDPVKTYSNLDLAPPEQAVGVAAVFQDAVDLARRSMEQSLVGNERIGEAVNLRLTIDLSDRPFMKIPDEVIDIIKTEVESKNKLDSIPNEIGEMRALRVFSVMHNKIRNVSAHLATMDNVKIMKLGHNPLNPELKRIVDQGASPPSEGNVLDNTSRDFDTTERVKKFLRATGSANHLSEEDSSDAPLDTPRAPTRSLSSRFPVKPSTSGSEIFSDINGRSPGFAKPPIPMRSHYRIPSAQKDAFHSAALRRPSLAPLSNGNERNRSNSESVLQATQSNRTKQKIPRHLLMWLKVQKVYSIPFTKGDHRYIRTMLFLMQGGVAEKRNGCSGVVVKNINDSQEKATNPQISVTSGQRSKRDDRLLTPTREHPNPQRRWRNGTPFQPTGYFSPVPSGAQTAVPLYVNGRSRSNSRTGPFLNSNTSSIANTPRSGESFMVPATPQIRSRSNSALGGYFNPTHNLLNPPEHDAIFEKIYNCLVRTVELSQKDIPPILIQATKCLGVAETSEKNKPFVNLWSAIILRSKHCLEICDILKTRLRTIKLNDTEIRYARDFWRLCTKLFDGVIKLLDGIKEARRLELVSKDMIYAIKPILKTVKEATHLVSTSPWSQLLEAETPERKAVTPQPISNGVHHHDQQQHHRYRSRTGSGNSPYLNNIPATPLSAALGPAAQATLPTNASLDRSFAGDIYQRADEYFRVQQTIVPRR